MDCESFSVNSVARKENGMKNSDRIRAMNDAELAEFAILSSKFFCTKKFGTVCDKPMGCISCALAWLQQESEGNG